MQNVRLLSGNAPEAFAELLSYDCRLMNTAARSQGGALRLRNWLTESDEWLSRQAAILSPEATIDIARAIVGSDTPYHRTIAVGRSAVEIVKRGIDQKRLGLTRVQHRQ